MSEDGSAATSLEGHVGLRPRLRAGVAALHARLDRIIEASCLGDPLEFRRLLAIHYAALCAVVPALESAGAARLFPGWDGRSRLFALEADMAEWGSHASHCDGIEASFRSEQEVWGALYAVEGSRLGNQVLLRKLAKHRDCGQRAMRFLAHCPDEGAAWPRLAARVEALDYRGEDFEAALRGAETVFAMYLLAAEQHAPE
jgi:heme oxygenase